MVELKRLFIRENLITGTLPAGVMDCSPPWDHLNNETSAVCTADSTGSDPGARKAY